LGTSIVAVKSPKTQNCLLRRAISAATLENSQIITGFRSIGRYYRTELKAHNSL
jgi:hypothetical protein